MSKKWKKDGATEREDESKNKDENKINVKFWRND